jgi:spermidine synthase
VMLSNAIAFLVVPGIALLVKWLSYSYGYGLVALSGAAMGVVFPLLCQYAVDADARSGEKLSWLYVANILGSGAGSLGTGFILMDQLPLHILSLVL